MTKTHILANLNARLCRTNPKALKKVSKYCLESDLVLDKSNSLQDLTSFVELYCQNQISTLAILGGDGTISRTLSELIKIYSVCKRPLPKVVILGGGTANVLATNLRVSSSPLKNLKKLSKNTMKSFTLRPLEVNNEYGFLFADGCAVSYLKKFYANKGNLAAACWLVLRLSISGMINGKSYRQLVHEENKTLFANEKKYSLNSLVTFVSTIEKIPPRISFFKNNMNSINTMRALDFSMSPRSLVYRLLGIVSVKKGGIPLWAKAWESDKIVINNLKPWSYTIDGEVFDAVADEVEIRLGPEIEFLI